MTNTPQIDNAIRLVESEQPGIARWALRCYQEYGRGMDGAYFPEVPSDLLLQMSYSRIHLLPTRPADADEDRRVVLRMVETCDPDPQLVVVAFMSLRTRWP